MRYSEILRESVDQPLAPFVEKAQQCDNVETFIQETEDINALLDVLYRGHYEDMAGNNVFMTNYIGHAAEYAGDTGRVDAFAYDPKDVLYYNDNVFDHLRDAYRNLSTQQLAAIYKGSIAMMLLTRRQLFAKIKKILEPRYGESEYLPYSEFSDNPSINDLLIPLLQLYARERGKNIIAFRGGDYGGDQTEYVVGDISKLVNLRELYQQVHRNMPHALR